MIYIEDNYNKVTFRKRNKEDVRELDHENSVEKASNFFPSSFILKEQSRYVSPKIALLIHY
jgi:hypothetical protein